MGAEGHSSQIWSGICCHSISENCTVDFQGYYSSIQTLHSWQRILDIDVPSEMVPECLDIQYRVYRLPSSHTNCVVVACCIVCKKKEVS